MDELAVVLQVLQTLQLHNYAPTLASMVLCIILAIALYFCLKERRLCRRELAWWRERAKLYEREKERLVGFLAEFNIAALTQLENLWRLLMRRRLLGEFLRILDRDGVVSLEELEKIVHNGSRRARNIMLLVGQDGQEWEALREFIAKKYGHDRPRSLLRMYVASMLEKRFKEYIESIVDYNIYVSDVRPSGFRGVSSFVLVLRAGVDVYESIILGYRIVSDFYNFLRSNLKECIEMGYCKPDLENHLHLLVNPIFMFTPPLPPQILLSSLKDVPEVEQLRAILVALGEERKRIRYLLGGAKVAHLFWVAGYGEEIVDALKRYEESIRWQLGVSNFMDYFTLADPLHNILEAIRRLDKQLYDSIIAEKRKLNIVAELITELKKLSDIL